MKPLANLWSRLAELVEHVSASPSHAATGRRASAVATTRPEAKGGSSRKRSSGLTSTLSG